jgi:WD40 repeat protein
MWDLNTGRSLMIDDGHVARIQALVLTPDGNTAVTADGITVRFWDTRTGKEIRRLGNHAATTLALSSDGRTLVTDGYDSKTVVLWDMATGKELRRIAVKEDPGRVDISPDGKTVAATAFHNFTIHLFDADTGKETRVLVGNTVGEGGVSPLPVRFSPDGKFLATLVKDETRGVGIGLWDLSKRDASTPALYLQSGYAWDLAFSPDAEYLAWTDYHNSHVWDMRARKLLPIKAPRGRVAFTPDGRYLIAGAKLIPLDPKHTPRELPLHPWCIACSRDSNTLVVVPPYECTALVLDARKLGK